MTETENLSFCYNIFAADHYEQYSRLKDSFTLLKKKIESVSVGVEEINGVIRAVEEYEKNPSFEACSRVIDINVAMM